MSSHSKPNRPEPAAARSTAAGSGAARSTAAGSGGPSGQAPGWLARLEETTDELVAAVEALEFGPPVTHVYNPLSYARQPYRTYLRRFAAPPKEALFVGMNPGPFGMAQTGIPFGDVTAVSEWMGIREPVGRPEGEHPRRPVLGFGCPRSEVSGSRLWGWARDTFGTAEAFFGRFFVANYCPLVFMEDSGRNRTPNRLSREERAALYAACDEALARTVAILQPRVVVGIGRFAEERAHAALSGTTIPIGRILHPSPASPAANRGWRESVEAELAGLGIRLPGAAEG